MSGSSAAQLTTFKRLRKASVVYTSFNTVPFHLLSFVVLQPQFLFNADISPYQFHIRQLDLPIPRMSGGIVTLRK